MIQVQIFSDVMFIIDELPGHPNSMPDKPPLIGTHPKSLTLRGATSEKPLGRWYTPMIQMGVNKEWHDSRCRTRKTQVPYPTLEVNMRGKEGDEPTREQKELQKGR